MASHNDVTGDALVSKRTNDNYRNNYDLIFGKKNKNAEKKESEDTNVSVETDKTQE